MSKKVYRIKKLPIDEAEKFVNELIDEGYEIQDFDTDLELNKCLVVAIQRDELFKRYQEHVAEKMDAVDSGGIPEEGIEHEDEKPKVKKMFGGR